MTELEKRQRAKVGAVAAGGLAAYGGGNVLAATKFSKNFNRGFQKIGATADGVAAKHDALLRKVQSYMHKIPDPKRRRIFAEDLRRASFERGLRDNSRFIKAADRVTTKAVKSAVPGAVLGGAGLGTILYAAMLRRKYKKQGK